MGPRFCLGEMSFVLAVIYGSKRTGWYAHAILSAIMYLLQNFSGKFGIVVWKNSKVSALSKIWDLLLNRFTQSMAEAVQSACLHFQNTIRSVHSLVTFLAARKVRALFQYSFDVNIYLLLKAVWVFWMSRLLKFANAKPLRDLSKIGRVVVYLRRCKNWFLKFMISSRHSSVNYFLWSQFLAKRI